MEQLGVELATYNKQLDNNKSAVDAMPPLSDTRTVTSDEDSEKKSVSVMKSRFTHSLTENISPQMDLAIEQLEKDHYLYRRGSTQVHVQTYAGPTAEDIAGESSGSQMVHNGLKLISALLGMMLFIISLSIKLSAALTYYSDDSHSTETTTYNQINEEVPRKVVDQYNLALYAFGSLWCLFYLFKGALRNKSEVKFLKNHQRSNRWLKGVIVLFGLGILLKEGLAFISYLMVDVSACPENNIKIAVAVFRALFIVTQTKYIFKFFKAYIRNCNTGSSTGLMIMIAINLSTWSTAVIDETLHALHLDSYAQKARESHTEHTSSSNLNTTQAVSMDTYASTDENVSDACSCDSDFCEAAGTADTFLFPFLIEYSLVASCLVYIIWNNVGKKPHPCEGVVKPSYKFYGHYHGSSAACVVFFLTIIFLVLLGTSGSSLPPEAKNYFSELPQLNLYMCFLSALEFLMLLATLWGMYLFYRICRPLEKASMLDQVLLIVCVAAPFMYNTFSMIAVISGQGNKSTLWAFTLLHPLVDQLQCLFQLVFILYGLRREPITSATAKETAAQLKQGIQDHFKRSAVDDDQASEAGFDNKTFLRSRRNSVTSVVTRLASSHPLSSPPPFRNYMTTDSALQSPDFSKITMRTPDIVISPSSEELDKTEEEEEQPTTSIEQESNGSVDDYKHTILKIVSEMHVARPNALRFRLRDVIIFLLGANACIWLFMSLSGTAFQVFLFEAEFFGPSTWTIITMICRPLTIFYRMHSAGCLFEMWSFA